jgi:hypothetical protein
MERRDIDELEHFLTSVGRPTLFAYYGLDLECDAAAAEDAVKKRRTWAQGQQSNPKYKAEALFLIKSNGLIRRLLVEQLEDYRAFVREDGQLHKLNVLTLFIRETLAGRALDAQAEAAIQHQGRGLDLSEAAITRCIEDTAAAMGVARVVTPDDDVSSEALALDVYTLLGVQSDASDADIEAAYRTRYRWVRNLKDLKRSSEALQALDHAWRILSDPGRRARYDERRQQVRDLTDEVERRTAAVMGLLGSPDESLTAETPLPALPPPPVHEVGFRAASPSPPPIRLPHASPTPPPTEPAAENTSGTPVSGRVPTPPPVSGRTIGLADGPQPVAVLGPRLSVEGPEVVRLQIGKRPAKVRWTVVNAGQGMMPGRVVTDREWLEAKRPRLDPKAARQEISITVLPEGVAFGRSAGTVTVVTDHGERRTLTIQVERSSWVPYAAAAAGALVLLLGGWVAWGSLRPSDSETLLELTVDPLADRVRVNDQVLGSGRSFEIREPEPGRAFSVQIEADGFVPQEEQVLLSPGRRTSRTVVLRLDTAAEWTPPTASRVEPPPSVRAGLKSAGSLLGPCFRGAAHSPVIATYTAWVTPDGQVRRVSVSDSSPTMEGSLPCVQRTFRGLRLPTFEGSYTVLEETLAVEVPS